MSRRATHARRTGDDESLVFAPSPHQGLTLRSDSGPAGLHAHVLGLQRTVGNRAVATLVVQRKDRPQSTDAPGAKKKAKPKPAKKEAPAEDYAPKEANPKFSSWETGALATRGAQELGATVRNSWYFAAELFEEYWFRTKSRAAADYIARTYRKLDDAKRAAYWQDVMLGKIKPGEPKSVDEDMSDKAF